MVPLYNTPLEFLEELLDSVQNQTYQNWELCCVDAGQDAAVGQVDEPLDLHLQARPVEGGFGLVVDQGGDDGAVAAVQRAQGDGEG